MADQWFYRLFGEEFGPVSRSALDSMIEDGQLGEDDEIRSQDSSTWLSVRTLVAQAKGNGLASMEGESVVSLESLSDARPEDFAEAHGASTVTHEGWFYQSLGQDWGPLTFEELLEHASRGDLSPDDQIRLGGKGKWRRAGSMGRLMAVMPYQTQQKDAGTSQPKSEPDDFETSVAFKENSPEPPGIAPPPPTQNVAPPPHPPMAPPPIAQYAPAYAPQQAPAWGYGQPTTAVDQGWYAWLGGVECGPMEVNQVISWAQSGRIGSQDYVKQGRYSQWTAANTIPGLIPAAPQPPAPPVVATPAPPRPLVQPLAPPVKPAVTAAAPVAPAVAKPPVSAPAPVAPVPKPALSAGVPPNRPPADDWNSSSATSSFGGGMGSSAPMMSRPGFTPPKKSTPPSKKGKKKSSGGGDMDVGALMKDTRVLGGLGGLVLIGLLYYGWTMMPEGTGKYVIAHKQLTDIYAEVEKKAKAKPAEAEWKEAGKAIKKKVDPVKKEITSNTKSIHPAKGKLSGAASDLGNVFSKPPAEAEAKLKDAKKKLDEAAKALKIAK